MQTRDNEFENIVYFKGTEHQVSVYVLKNPDAETIFNMVLTMLHRTKLPLKYTDLTNCKGSKFSLDIEPDENDPESEKKCLLKAARNLLFFLQQSNFDHKKLEPVIQDIEELSFIFTNTKSQSRHPEPVYKRNENQVDNNGLSQSAAESKHDRLYAEKSAFKVFDKQGLVNIRASALNFITQQQSQQANRSALKKIS